MDKRSKPILNRSTTIKKKVLHRDGTTIYDLNNGYVVRVAPVVHLRENIPPSKRKDADLIQHLAGKADTCFEFMSEYQGLNIIKVDHRNISGSSPVKLYTKTERVYGRSLFALDLEKAVPYSMILSFINGMSDYIHDMNKGKFEYIWNDIKSRQFMYGHTKSNPTNLIYLTDIDPIVFKHTKETQDDAVVRVKNMILRIKDEYPNTDTRQLTQILNNLPEVDENHIDWYTRFGPGAQ